MGVSLVSLLSFSTSIFQTVKHLFDISFPQCAYNLTLPACLFRWKQRPSRACRVLQILGERGYVGSPLMTEDVELREAGL